MPIWGLRSVEVAGIWGKVGRLENHNISDISCLSFLVGILRHMQHMIPNEVFLCSHAQSQMKAGREGGSKEGRKDAWYHEITCFGTFEHFDFIWFAFNLFKGLHLICST